MDEFTNEINISQIMQEIKNEIAEKGYIDEAVDFEDILNCSNKSGNYDELEWDENLRMVNVLNTVPLYREMAKGVKTFVKKVIRKATAFLLVPVIEEQNNYNAHVARCLNQLDGYLKGNQNLMENQIRNSKRIFQLEKKVEDKNIYENKLAKLKDEIEILNKNEDRLIKLEKNENEIAKLKDKIEILNKNEDRLLKLEKEESVIEKLEINLRNNNAQISMLEMSNEMINTKLNILLEEKKNKSFKVKNEITSQIVETNEYTCIDYFDFENYFRGTREEIIKVQTQYAKYFEEQNNVLDLGCGRGEFLEILSGIGVNAIGIDIYGIYISYCEQKGFVAKEADAIEYLRGCSNVGGIFCGQLVEHLDYRKIMELCNLSYDKLKEGSYIVIETPNPMSLAIFTHSFYIDPSHEKPVHPYTLQYFLKKAGFKKIEIIFSESSKLSNDILQLKSENAENIGEFNEGVKKIWDTLYGSQDYAIIAQK